MTLLIKLALIFLCYNIASTMAARRVGGISDDEKPSDENVENLVTSLASEIKTEALEAHSGADGVSKENLEEHYKSANITSLAYKTQLVAGTNYFIRTRIGDYIFHVRIYRDLQKNASLSKVIGPKEESDPIEYF